MTHNPENFVCWAEIPVTDLDAGMTYYGTVLQTELRRVENMGPNPYADFVTRNPMKGVAGHLYPGKPPAKGTGPTIHLVIDGKLEDAMERTRQAGGEVVSEPITIPPGRFAYTLDPDGNSIGLFETA